MALPRCNYIQMAKLLFLIVIFHLESFGQIRDSIVRPNWSDTTYKIIVLKTNLNDKKIIKYVQGTRSIIYFNLSDIRDLLSEKAHEDGEAKDYAYLLSCLDSIAKATDTISLSCYDNQFKVIADELLVKGDAIIYDRAKKEFPATIASRLEKYSSVAIRFFYLKDLKPFFANLEYSGILEDDNYLSDSAELFKAGEKLREVGK